MNQLTPIFRGSDAEFIVEFTTSAGAPVDLTGVSLEVFEPHPLLEPYISVTVTDAPAGHVRVRIEWSDEYPTGRQMSFRLRAEVDGEYIAYPEITVAIQ